MVNLFPTLQSTIVFVHNYASTSIFYFFVVALLVTFGIAKSSNRSRLDKICFFLLSENVDIFIQGSRCDLILLAFTFTTHLSMWLHIVDNLCAVVLSCQNLSEKVQMKSSLM